MCSSSVQAGPNNIFVINNNAAWWLAMPGRANTTRLFLVNGTMNNLLCYDYGNQTRVICPIVSLIGLD